MARISAQGLTKVYADGTVGLRDFSLEIEEGEFVTLVGPSGCGKTTALRMIAGLEEITSGTLKIGDRVVNDVAPLERDVAMVFQNYALYPHLTVAENIGFPLEMRNVPKAERRAKVEEAARVLGLEGYLSRKPRNLSGGQRQRVAMGRAIVRRPAVFLMDEPLSNLDAKLRVQMRAEVQRIQRQLGVATLYVTHDQTEAVTMGDRVVVMRDGALQQNGTPHELYEHPVNMFVGAFIGSPAMNLYRGEIVRADGQLELHIGSQSLELPPELVARSPRLAAYAGRSLIVGIRPEQLSLPDPGNPPRSKRLAALTADAELVEDLGNELFVHFRLGVPRLSENAVAATAGASDESVEADAGVARVAPRSRVRSGDRVTFDVVVDGLYFFDEDTGAVVGGRSSSRRGSTDNQIVAEANE